MKIKFEGTQNKEFYKVLKERVDRYFVQNHLSTKGNALLWMKASVVLLIQLGLYITLLSNLLSPLAFIFTFMLFGLATSLINFTIVHDALHGAFSEKPWVNKMMGYLYDLNGISSEAWKITHNTLHHTYTNIPGYDEDINKAILLRLNPKDHQYPFHFYQNIYAIFLYSLVSINWIFYTDYTIMWKEYQKGRMPRKDLGIFFGFKFLNIFLLIILPLLVVNLPFWIILLGFLSAHFAAGIMVSIIFQLAHIVDNVSYFEPDDQGAIANYWAAHEILTTANFATHNLLLTHLIGGLNYQIEHHLFPYICHVHYPAIQPIVKATAEEHGLPYHENPTFLSAIRSHYVRLKELGREKSVGYD